MIRLEVAALPTTREVDTKPEVQPAMPPYLLPAAGIVLLAFAVLLFLLYSAQKRSMQTMHMLRKQVQHLELAAYSSGTIADAGGRKVNGRMSMPALEKKLASLNRELESVAKENEQLNDMLAEAKDVRLDFEAVKQKMMEVYKIRNYPGFNKEKTETEIVKGLLDTERSVALYAYEHFLKPVLAIADANKNNPARIKTEEREKLLDLLISLSLLYSEYLYLRIGDLSIGGKIAERIGSLKNGSQVDPATLKNLNMEHGSRALVLRMVLDKTPVQHLSYPVFDETNLNQS